MFGGLNSLIKILHAVPISSRRFQAGHSTSHWKIEEADQERIRLLLKAGFPVNRIVKVLELEKGVQPGQLTFIEKDIRNFACRAAAEGDDGFVYNFTTYDNGKVENIAWTYGDSIRAFSLFGDVVTINTSYWSIAYCMILAMWFCIDNHGRSILFGCTLLQDQTSKSFSCAIQVFIRFMRERHPETVIIDMDPGLRDALAKPVFTHGQLHIVVSRVTSRGELKILLDDNDTNTTTNAVYREVFQNL